MMWIITNQIMSQCPIVEAYRRRNSLKYATILAPDVKKQMQAELQILNLKILQIEKGCSLCNQSLLDTTRQVQKTRAGLYVHKRCLKKNYYKQVLLRSVST